MKILFRYICLFLTISLIGCGFNQDKSDDNLPIHIINSPDELPSTLSSQKALFISTMLTVDNRNQVDDNLLVSLDQTYSKVLNVKGRQFSLSADGKYIIYASYGDSGEVSVEIFDIETGKTQELFTSDDVPSEVAYGGLSDPSFSHDGQSVIFRIDFTRTSFGLGLYSLADDAVMLLPAEGLNMAPQFSPSSDKILSICEGKRVVGFQICIMDSDGRHRMRLSEEKGSHEAWFSPDNEHIVYEHRLTRVFGDPVIGLYVMDLSGENVIQLMDAPTHLLTFSTDGKDIVFCKFPQDVYKTENFICEGVYVIGIDGKNLRKLAYFDEDFLSKWK